MHLHWAGKQFSPYPAITISLFCSWGYPWRKEHFKAAKQSKWWTEKVLSYLGIDGKSLDYWKVLEGPPLLCDQWSDQCPLGPVLLVWSGHITPLPRSIFPRIRGGWVGWGLSWCQPKFSARGWRTHVLPSDWFRQHISKHLRNNFCKGSRQTRSEEKVGRLDQPGVESDPSKRKSVDPFYNVTI